MINTEDLAFSYSKEVSFQFPDIKLDAGQELLLLGQSGVGKTTLLHILGGLLPPTSGIISINNTHLSTLSKSAQDDFRAKHIGIIFQKNHFVHALNVQENIDLVQSIAGQKVDPRWRDHLLETLGLSHRAKAKIKSLSEGEKQRVSIIRALINRPTLLLADEPTSALDDENCDRVVNLLRKQTDEINASLIVVTHDTRLKAILPNQIILS